MPFGTESLLQMKAQKREVQLLSLHHESKAIPDQRITLWLMDLIQFQNHRQISDSTQCSHLHGHIIDPAKFPERSRKESADTIQLNRLEEVGF
jgi:hypothetical protein